MHDPMAAFPPERLDPAPWATLAAQARAIADLAEQYAALPPADLAPVNGRDPILELDAAAKATVATVAACRRATWQALYDSGVSAAEIGARWGVTRQAVTSKITTR